MWFSFLGWFLNHAYNQTPYVGVSQILSLGHTYVSGILHMIGSGKFPFLISRDLTAFGVHLNLSFRCFSTPVLGISYPHPGFTSP